MTTALPALLLAASTAVANANTAAVVDARFQDGRDALASNPARGAAPGGWHVLKKSGNEAGQPEGFCSWLWNIGAFSGGNDTYKGQPPPPNCIGGVDAPLTEDALAAVSNTLVNANVNITVVRNSNFFIVMNCLLLPAKLNKINEITYDFLLYFLFHRIPIRASTTLTT